MLHSEFLDHQSIDSISLLAKIFYSLTFFLKVIGFCGKRGKKFIFSDILKFEFFLFFTFLREDVFFLNNLRIPLFIIEVLNQFNPRLALNILGLIKYLFGYVFGFFFFLLFTNLIFTDYEIRLFGNDFETFKSKNSTHFNCIESWPDVFVLLFINKFNWEFSLVFNIESIKFFIFRGIEFFFNFILEKFIEILFLIMFISSLLDINLQSKNSKPSIFQKLYKLKCSNSDLVSLNQEIKEKYSESTFLRVFKIKSEGVRKIYTKKN